MSDVNIEDLPLAQQIQVKVAESLSTPKRLFIVNGILDLTELITAPSYAVSLEDEYDEWTDNNRVIHRDIVAKKAKGGFSIKFETSEQYFTFIHTMKDCKKTNGSYDCTVYLNNEDETINAEMFIDYDMPDIAPIIGAIDYNEIEITVEQRTNQYAEED